MPSKKESFTIKKRADIDYPAVFNEFIRGLDNQGFKNVDLEPGKMIKIKETRPPIMGDWPVTTVTEMVEGEDSVLINMHSSNFGFGPIQKKHCVKIHNFVKNRLMVYLEGELPEDHFTGSEMKKGVPVAKQNALQEPEELPEEYEELDDDYEEEDFSEYEELLKKEAEEA